jgi:hypothetical protein
MAWDVVASSLTAPAVPVQRDGVGWMAPSDDAGVRLLLRRSVLPGTVRVALTRDPLYALGEGLAGAEDYTVVYRHRGRISGVGRLSVHTLLRNGDPARVGYLSELRLEENTPRAPLLLRDGYELLRPTMATLDACVTSISAENVRARRVLEHATRLGLPTYRHLTDMVTFAAPVGRLDRSTPAMCAEPVADFLASSAPRTHLSLPWTRATLAALSQHGVSASDWCATHDADGVRGTAALWDQRKFRQVVIDGYSGALQTLRPALNLGAHLLGRHALPAPGAVLAQGTLLGATVRSPTDWPALWRALQPAARARGLEWLTILRDVRDPETAVLRHCLRGAHRYHTRLYDVRWPDTAPSSDWDDRLFRPEVGLL